MQDYAIRIFANACITRYTRGEGTIPDILASYNLPDADEAAVLAEIYKKRPDLAPAN